MAIDTTSKLFFFTFLTFSYLISTINVVTFTHARNLHITTVALDNSGGAVNLLDCWNGALELKSCTDEIVKFFLNRNGTTEPAVSGEIDKGCCQAIELVEKDCWSVMFTSLGLTTMEGNNLREYCDVQSEKSEFSPAPAPESLVLYPVEISY